MHKFFDHIREAFGHIFRPLLNTAELYRLDASLLLCHGCHLSHVDHACNPDAAWENWITDHPMNGYGRLNKGKWGPCFPQIILPDRHVEPYARRTEWDRKMLHLSRNYAHNTNTNQFYDTANIFSPDLTVFKGLISSLTAGWCSNYFNNTTAKYLDLITQFAIDPAMTGAPASGQRINIYSAGSLSTAVLPTTGAATGAAVRNDPTVGGSITFPDISQGSPNVYQVAYQRYLVSGADVSSPLFPVAWAYKGGGLPIFHWYMAVNNMGVTIPNTVNNVFSVCGVALVNA